VTAGALFVRTVEFDPSVIAAQVAGTDVVSAGGPAAAAIEAVWNEAALALAARQKGDVSHV
jgi:hypothetical protein